MPHSSSLERVRFQGICDLDLATTLANCIYCTYDSGNPWSDLIKRSRLHDKGANDRVSVSDTIDYLVDTLVFVVRSIFSIYVSFLQFLLKYLTSSNCLPLLPRSFVKFQSTQVRTFFITNIHRYFALISIFNAVKNFSFDHRCFRLLFLFFSSSFLPFPEKVRTCHETRLSFIVSRAMLIGI